MVGFTILRPDHLGSHQALHLLLVEFAGRSQTAAGQSAAILIVTAITDFKLGFWESLACGTVAKVQKNVNY